MKIFGIETSCDETSVAVVENGKKVLSNVIVSSLNEHKKYGGIIPEIASRRQLESIQLVAGKALEGANLKLKDIDAIAVTQKPGLIGSLLVGISFARALKFAIARPLLEVNHIQAHLYANFLVQKNEHNKILPHLPVIGLVVSGGHTSLYYIKTFQDFKLIGATRDDAAGEAFDKVARILNLGYPGGPVIDKLSQQSQEPAIPFKCADMPNTFDFSFSGIKTAVLYHYRDNHKKKNFSQKAVCHGFQKSVVSVLVKKSLAACYKFKTPTIVVGGGVAANSALRKVLVEEAGKENIKVYFPPLSLCLDNAAMIAGLGYHL
ncbi:N(6)-L-threonylcarbamoyladenine synthase [hydrothermal vent metagenome]|uniref:N(6)-L-threonylcarbamoyladenine synthase n=1 Tax=hydrothermal vent metagenome TaxID=652676 RepID=A0A3B1DFA6_9ZZZZ